MTQSIAIILNPHARQGKAARLKPLLMQWVKSHGVPATVYMCGTELELQKAFAQIPQGSRVIGVGGDGTNHRLLPYLLQGQHSYGLVPYGSGDDVARAIGVFGLSWQEALHHAVHAPATGFDIGLMTSSEDALLKRYFLGCCLLGIDGAISNKTQSWKMRGPVPYFLTLLTMLPKLQGWSLQGHYQLDTGDAVTLPMQQLILCSVLNTPTYGSGYPIAPGAVCDDGRFTFLYAPMVGRIKFLQLFFKMLKALHVNAPECHLAQITRLHVQSDQPLTVSADGEHIDWQVQSIDMQLLPKALNIVRR